jgi:hypothetical protein
MSRLVIASTLPLSSRFVHFHVPFYLLRSHFIGVGGAPAPRDCWPRANNPAQSRNCDLFKCFTNVQSFDVDSVCVVSAVSFFFLQVFFFLYLRSITLNIRMSMQKYVSFDSFLRFFFTSGLVCVLRLSQN